MGSVLYLRLCYDAICLTNPWLISREIGTHSGVRDGCHVSTLFGLGRDNFIGIKAPIL